MSRARRIGMALGLVMGLCVAGASAAAPPAGHVRAVRGPVELLHASGATESAIAGTPLLASDTIRTGANAGASFVLRDGTTIVMGPSSDLDLKNFSYDLQSNVGELVVRLFRGSLRMITGIIGKQRPEAVRVETQTAVIGIRGTDFIVEVD